MDRFAYLKVGLALVLMFVGAKMLVMEWYKMPILLSLGVIIGILTSSVVYSLIKTRRAEAKVVAAAK